MTLMICKCIATPNGTIPVDDCPFHGGKDAIERQKRVEILKTNWKLLKFHKVRALAQEWFTADSWRFAIADAGMQLRIEGRRTEQVKRELWFILVKLNTAWVQLKEANA